MKKMSFILLFLALAAHGQQERIAILNALANPEGSIELADLSYLTDNLSNIAVNILSRSNKYFVMDAASVVDFFGSQEHMMEECNKAECAADVARTIEADYTLRAIASHLGEDRFSIKVELRKYKKGSELIGSFMSDSKSLQGLSDAINEKTPILLREKLPGTSGGKVFAGGFSGMHTAGGDYEFDGGKSYVASIATEPEGASLSFNGVQDTKCSKTPCSVVLGEGSVRIIANLEQYEIADTTVSIKQNSQSIRIRMKANFGVLEIKPIYLDGIGADRQWNLSINDKPYSLGEIRLSPNKYAVRLNHECYEDIAFEAGINKDRREVFDMARNIVLKKGGLVLSTEADDVPVSEPVYVNGKHVGETPFSGSVPVCAKVEIGNGREAVDVKIKHNMKVEYVHNMNTEELRRRKEQQREREEEERREQKNRADWERLIFTIGGGGYFSREDVNPLQKDGGSLFYINAEFVSLASGYLRFGGDLDIGMIPIGYNDQIGEVWWLRGGASAKLDFHCLYLVAGAGWYTDWTDYDIKSYSGPSFSVGGGLMRGGLPLAFGLQYFVMPTIGRNASYVTVKIGLLIPYNFFKKFSKGKQ